MVAQPNKNKNHLKTLPIGDLSRQGFTLNWTKVRLICSLPFDHQVVLAQIFWTGGL